MDCPKCRHDLTKFETFDNIYGFLICPSCSERLFLDYDEYCTEDYSDCWDYWIWETSEAKVFKDYDRPGAIFINS